MIKCFTDSTRLCDVSGTTRQKIDKSLSLDLSSSESSFPLHHSMAGLSLFPSCNEVEGRRVKGQGDCKWRGRVSVESRILPLFSLFVQTLNKAHALPVSRHNQRLGNVGQGKSRRGEARLGEETWQGHRMIYYRSERL